SGAGARKGLRDGARDGARNSRARRGPPSTILARSFAPVRLLITRPRADAEAFAQILRRRGHVAIVAPLMEVVPHDGPPLALDSVQAVLATSANGVRALAARAARRDVPLYAVGPQTAEAAEQEG